MKDNLRFKNKSFIKYISPFMFNSMSQSLKNINELLSKDLSTKENSEEFKKSLGMDPKQLFNEFFEEYASYAPNRKNLKYVGNIDKKSSSFTKVQDGIKFNLFGNIEKHNFKQKLTEDELKTFSKNKQDLGKIFNRAVDENSGFTVFEFPRFVTYRGKVYKLTELQNRALKNLKTSPNFEDSETIYKGTSANYSLVDSVDKGILPYAFDLTENKQISDLLGIETKDSEPIPDSDPNPEPPDTGDAPFDYSDNIVYSNDQFNEAIKKEENSNKPVKKITEKSTTKVDEIWNKNSDNIQVKYPDITKEIWNLMTEEEKQRLIDCL